MSPQQGFTQTEPQKQVRGKRLLWVESRHSIAHCLCKKAGASNSTQRISLVHVF
jgi:hypothetical protein